jgi:hypothetical protein
MADVTMPQQAYTAPAAVDGEKKKQYIQKTPLWVVVVRALQIFFSFVIVVMAGVLIHGHAMGPNGFAVVCGLFTWIVVGYMLISEKMTSAHGAYNIWAVLSLDLLMVIFWLASLGANAQLRSRFVHPVQIEACFNDGSATSSNHCIVSRSIVSKRAAVAGPLGLALMSAIAGLSALEWLLFLATLIFHGHTFRLWHQEHKKPSPDNATVEMKAQGTPMLGPQQPTATHPQYTDQQQYQSTMYPPQQPDAAYTQSPSPAPYPPQQQHPAAAAYPPQPQQQQQQHQPYGVYPDPAQYPQQQQQQQQQQPYSPHGTPMSGQPYYPPQQPHP